VTRGNSLQIVIPVEETSGIAEARRRVAALAAPLGFDGTTAGALAIAVTEAATNIVKHATRGSIVARSLEAGDLRGVEVVALDHGRGIPNLRASMRTRNRLSFPSASSAMPSPSQKSSNVPSPSGRSSRATRIRRSE